MGTVTVIRESPVLLEEFVGNVLVDLSNIIECMKRHLEDTNFAV